MNAPRRAPALVFVAVAGCSLVSTAFAQGPPVSSIYSCRDAAGNTITSDRPAAECVGVVRELGPSGVVRRLIAPPLTAEQRRQKAADDVARRLADDAAREKKQRDSALLAAYPSEAQLEASRRRSLASTSDSMKASQARLADLVNERKAYVQEGDQYRDKPMPPLVRRRLDDNQAAIDDEEAAVKQREADIERINQRFDEDLRRLRELSGATPGKAP